MDISRYGIFCEVVKNGNITRTAESLGYSQSAVSQTVKSLEKEMGATLITRGRDGLHLTRDGEAYMPFIQSVYQAEQALHEKEREIQGLSGSLIRIGTFTSVSRNILPRLMQEFKTRYPGVHFELVQGEYTSIEHDILSGRVDFGFTSLEYVNRAESEAEGGRRLGTARLYQDEMLAVLPEDHPLAQQDYVSLADLADDALILLDEGEYSMPLNLFSAAGLRPHIEYKVTDDYTILAMIRQHLGVSLMFERVVRGFEQGLAVRHIRERPLRTIVLAWRDRKTMPIAAGKFADYIVQEIRKDSKAE
ncbi:MAG: LysR family transcriptional regulator [Eubacteriales bacterium]|nr:LysR family transcriptional regulator [Eubacteriales bacterium]